jgi:hypothetical protein
VTALDPEALGARAYAMISELGAISAEPACFLRQSIAVPPTWWPAGCAPPACR